MIVFYLSFFFLKKKKIYFPSTCFVCTDEVEFQEDGKFRLVCASRCSIEVYVGLDFDPKKNACCACHYYSCLQLFKCLYPLMLVQFFSFLEFVC